MMRSILILAIFITIGANGLFAADDLRPIPARWLKGDRILVISDAKPTAPWLVALRAACTAGEPSLRCRVECADASVAYLLRKMERLHLTGDVLVIAVGEADARRAAKGKAADFPVEFQRRVAAYATGAAAMGAVVVLLSTSADPQVISSIRAAATGAGVESTTTGELLAAVGTAAAHLPPRITIAGDRVFTKDTTLTVTVERTDPKTTKLRWWREPGDQSKATTQALSKPIIVSEPGLIQVRVEDVASGTTGSASVFLRKMDFLKPEKIVKLTPGLTWRSASVPLTKRGDLDLPSGASGDFSGDFSGGHSGKAALAEWPATVGEAQGADSAVVVLFDGYFIARQAGIFRFIANGTGTLRLDIGDHLVIEHQSRDTIDGTTIGSVPLMPGCHRVHLVMGRLPGDEPATLTSRAPKMIGDGPVKIDELGSMPPITAK